jgi:membrane peptidoglycan carboxypeptidase
MMAGGPAREGGPGDRRVARIDYDPQTVPLPYGTTSGDPYRNYPDDGPYPGYGDGGRYGEDPDEDYYLPGWPAYRRRRRWRVLRWLLGIVVALLMLSVIAFGVLFALTPSVGNAPALARAIDTAHHAAYPGPPVPPLFAESLVATEDHRFYSEPGVDIYAIARVAAAQITGHGDQGGATLYQQLAKMLYTPGQSGFSVEIKQVMLGVKLDLAYSKAKVLRMYADVAYFGHGYYGLAQASCGYFGTVPARLTLPEAATLAGLVQGPSADDPIEHYARGRAREAHVLSRLVDTGKIAQAQSTAAYAPQLPLVGGSGTSCTGR